MPHSRNRGVNADGQDAPSGVGEDNNAIHGWEAFCFSRYLNETNGTNGSGVISRFKEEKAILKQGLMSGRRSNQLEPVGSLICQRNSRFQCQNPLEARFSFRLPVLFWQYIMPPFQPCIHSTNTSYAIQLQSFYNLFRCTFCIGCFRSIKCSYPISP